MSEWFFLLIFNIDTIFVHSSPALLKSRNIYI